jgi:hypothetical protein
VVNLLNLFTRGSNIEITFYFVLVVVTQNSIKPGENLKKAIGILKECGSDGWLEKYEKELRWGARLMVR